MRESVRWTIGYQFLNIFLVNLGAIAVAFVFFAAAFYGFMNKPIIKEILSVIFIGVYFGMVYSRAHRFADKELRSYTATKPNVFKGVMFGVMLSLIFAIMLIAYRIMWIKTGVDGVITSLPAMVYSIVFWFYTMPYSGIMGLAHGHMMWYSVVLMLIIPIAATTLGYISGLKKFSILDKFSESIYEKKDD